MNKFLVLFFFCLSIVSCETINEIAIAKNHSHSLLVKQTFNAKVIKVADGDTVTVISNKPCSQQTQQRCVKGKIQYRIRLAEIDAPENGQPYGKKSSQILKQLVLNKIILVEETDTDRYGRMVAQLFVDNIWVNGEMVKKGAAWVYPQYAKTKQLYAYQEKAQQTKLGIWALQQDQIIAPWLWRRQHKKQPQNSP